MTPKVIKTEDKARGIRREEFVGEGPLMGHVLIVAVFETGSPYFPKRMFATEPEGMRRP